MTAPTVVGIVILVVLLAWFMAFGWEEEFLPTLAFLLCPLAAVAVVLVTIGMIATGPWPWDPNFPPLRQP